MKHWKSTIMAIALLGAFIIISGCKTTPQTPEQQATTMSNIVRAAEIVKVTVRTGVMVDVMAAPQHAPLIRKSVDALDTAISLGSLTGGQLAAIVATLPIDKQVVQIVSGSLLIYDSLSMLFMSPQSNAGTLIIAKAIADGAKEGLTLATRPAMDAGGLKAAAKKAPAFIPVPTAANTRKF